MRMFSKKMLGMLVLLGISTASSADDTGMYVYGDIGEAYTSLNQGQLNSLWSSSGVTGITSSANSNPTAFKLQLGYQFNQYWAIEGGYATIGNLNYSMTGSGGSISENASLSTHIWNLSAAGTLPFGGGFSGTGRLGYAFLQANANGTIGTYSFSQGYNKSDITYGLGLKYDINEKVSLRADVDNYTPPSNARMSQFNIWTIGAGYKF